MTLKTAQEVWDNLAECDRVERQQSLYGPYDPRLDEVMDGWRPSTLGPAPHTPEQRIADAAIYRRIAALMTDADGVASTLALARALDAGNEAEQLSNDGE